MVCPSEDPYAPHSRENVRHVANTVPEMVKKVVIKSMSGSLEGDGPVAAACRS